MDKPIVRISLKHYEKLELLGPKYPIYYKQGRYLLDRGYQCLEGPRFIFIHTKEPEKKGPDYQYWQSTFGNDAVINGRVIKRKKERFLQIKLNFSNG